MMAKSHKISMPVDRLDIHVDVPPVRYAELASTVTTENSATIRARANAALALQRARFTGTAAPHNAAMGGREIRQDCEQHQRSLRQNRYLGEPACSRC